MTAVLRYTLLRTALFVVVLVGLSLIGASEVTAVVGAVAISLLLSYVLLRGPREAAARAIAERTQARLQDRQEAPQDAPSSSAPSEGSPAAPPAQAAPTAPTVPAASNRRRLRPRLQDDAAAEDANLDADPGRHS